MGEEYSMVETTGKGSGGIIHTKVFRCSPADVSREDILVYMDQLQFIFVRAHSYSKWPYILATYG